MLTAETFSCCNAKVAQDTIYLNMPESTVGKEKDFYIAFPPNGAYDMFKLEEKADEENPYDEFDQDMDELYLKVRVRPLITVSFPSGKVVGFALCHFAQE